MGKIIKVEKYIFDKSDIVLIEGIRWGRFNTLLCLNKTKYSKDRLYLEADMETVMEMTGFKVTPEEVSIITLPLNSIL